MLPPLDTRRLADLGDDLGDEEFLQETVGIYLSELPGRRTAVRTAFDSDDRPGMRDCAHGLGSASEMLGALELAAACRAIELRAVESDPLAMADLVAQWTSSCDRAEAALAEWLSARVPMTSPD